MSGTPKQGQTLTANVGGWSGTAPIGYAFQWLRCDGNGNNCAVLGGQTKPTLRAAARPEVNTRIRVRITASNSLLEQQLREPPVREDEEDGRHRDEVGDVDEHEPRHVAEREGAQQLDSVVERRQGKRSSGRRPGRCPRGRTSPRRGTSAACRAR